jgi:phosphatidylserine/phosphatidylglycerophosphate/cardiolipin synthase-like enzyme
MLIEAGTTCWRKAQADRASVLVDVAAYLAAVREACLRARSSIHILCWAFDPDTLFAPQPGGVGPENDRIGPFLRSLAAERPGLDVRILCWRSAFPIAATQRFFPHRAKECFAGTRVHFLLDATVPMGGCHHQKVVVIDDQVAFCGGCDICPDRWDTTEHLDDDARRERSAHSHVDFISRHEVMGLVEGPAAAALGELFRERWLRATGQHLVAAPVSDARPWPDGVEADFEAVEAGLSRTEPRWRGWPEVCEVEELHLAAIAGAKRCIYLENQYFTSPLVAGALAVRLAEPDGPEVVMIGARHSPSWFDRMTMDRTRSMFLDHLQAADRHGRLHAYVPVTEKGRLIIVHAKLMIVDDQLLRVGSANLNNRSCGFDTECDLTIEAADEDIRSRGAIRRIRSRLLAHWLGADVAAVETATAEEVGAGVEQLRLAGHQRLVPMRRIGLGPLAALIAKGHLGDPLTPGDSWRPWRRLAALVQAAAGVSQRRSA